MLTGSSLDRAIAVDAPLRAGRRGSLHAWNAAVLLVILVLGLSRLPQPFMGDQAVYALGGMTVSSGQALYRDLWDIKHPGIFMFYAVAGSIFGFTEMGIHAFELLYWLAFAALLIHGLRHRFGHPAAAGLAALFTAGLYYAIVTFWDQTQPEPLMGPLLFGALYLACTAPARSGRGFRWSLIGSGLCAGLALTVKFLVLPIVAAFWLLALSRIAARNDGYRLRSALEAASPILVGAAVPLLLVAAYLAVHGLMELALWTFVEYPARLLQTVPPNYTLLRTNALWFVQTFSPFFALAAVGVGAGLRRRDDLTAGLVLWCVLGLGVILMQRTSWWQYHFWLLLVPVGVLAAQGVDAIRAHVEDVLEAAAARWTLAVATAALLLAVSPAVAAAALHIFDLGRQDAFALSNASRRGHQARLHGHYRVVLGETAFLSGPSAPPGSLYVFADPLYYWISGRQPAVSLLAPWFRAVPEQWQSLLAQLDEKRPTYVFVERNIWDAIRAESSHDIEPYLERTLPFLERHYAVLRTSPAGTWYVIREGSPPADPDL